MEGKIAYSKPNVKGRYYYCDNKTASSRIQKIPEDVKRRFEDTELLCIEYTGLTRADQEELFSRVQKGVPLRPSEKMQATTGPLQDFARELIREYPVVRTLLENPGRALDFHLTVAVMLMIKYIDLLGEEAVFQATAAACGKFLLKNGDKCDRRFRDRLHRVFNIYSKLAETYPETFTNSWGPLTYNRKYSPMEWMSSAILIDRYYDTPVASLNEGIKELRKFIREKTRDIRLNQGTWKWIWPFILSLEEEEEEEDGEEEPPTTAKRQKVR